MTSNRFEEAKENITKEPRLRFIPESKDFSEEKLPLPPPPVPVFNEEEDGNEDNESGSSEEERYRVGSVGGEVSADLSRESQNRKKKRKKKDGKKLLMNSFWKQLNYKATHEAKSKENTILPIEEYFLTGDCFPLIKKGPCSLLLRILQTHFKAKDYDAYKAAGAAKPDTMKVSEENQKFYDRRYFLFSKFDQGIRLDEESTLPSPTLPLRLVFRDA